MLLLSLPLPLPPPPLLLQLRRHAGRVVAIITKLLLVLPVAQSDGALEGLNLLLEARDPLFVPPHEGRRLGLARRQLGHDLSLPLDFSGQLFHLVYRVRQGTGGHGTARCTKMKLDASHSQFRV